MGTTAFTWTRWRARQSLRWDARPRPLENRFATLWHGSTRSPVGCRPRRYRRRSLIYGPGPSLRNDQTTGCMRSRPCLAGPHGHWGTHSAGCGWRQWTTGARRRYLGGRYSSALNFQLRWGLDYRGLGCRNRNRGLFQNCTLRLGCRCRRFRAFDCGWHMWWRGSGRLRWSNHRG